jgi:D-arginine dehydrogenase
MAVHGVSDSIPDIVVIGGGIAGLSAAWQIARARIGRVVLLERESMLASHSSARNAAIWLPFEHDGVTVPLARRTAALLDELIGESWLTQCGAVLTGEHEGALESVIADARTSGIRAEGLTVAEAASLSPALEGGAFATAALIGHAGELDIHLMTTELARAARADGAQVRTGVGVRSLVARGDRVVAAELDDGGRLEAGLCVLASGAWAAELGATCGAALPIAPLRRHLAHLAADPGLAGTIVWNVENEVYYRPESGGVLASPGDQEPSPPCLPEVDPTAIEALATRLARFAPGLSSAGVHRSWACLRTFASDRELVIGPDPRVEGLFWMAGFGGRGMTVAPGAGELAAQWITGRRPALAPTLAPDRLLGAAK